MINRQTHRQITRYSVCSNRPHLHVAIAAKRPNTNNHRGTAYTVAAERRKYSASENMGRDVGMYGKAAPHRGNSGIALRKIFKKFISEFCCILFFLKKMCSCY